MRKFSYSDQDQFTLATDSDGKLRMPTSTSSYKVAYLVFSVLVLVLFFSFLGSYGLLEDNESRFFEISWEMAHTGDWMIPRLNFIHHFHKPPGTYWMVGAFIRVFGEHEWAGRLPIALAGLSTLALTVFWAEQVKIGPSTALLSGFALATCVEFWFLSRLVLTDMFLTFTVLATLLCAWKILSRSQGKWVFGFWGFLALSFLFKGPVGLAIVGLTLICYRLLKGPFAWKSFFSLPGLLLFAAISLPWYIAVCTQYDGLLGYFLKFQTLERVASKVHGRPGPIWFYLPVILAGFFPWSSGLWAAVKRAYQRRDDFDLFLFSWLLGPLVLFSLSGSKLPTYILPLFPALSMLIGRVVDSEALKAKMGFSSSVGLGIFSLALAVFMAKGLPEDLASAHLHLKAIVALTALGSLAAVVSYFRKNIDLSLIFVGVSFGLVLMTLASAVHLNEENYSSRRLSEELQRILTPESVVAEVSCHLHGLPYYLRRQLVHISYPRELFFEKPGVAELTNFTDVPSFMESLKPGQKPILVIRKSDYEEHKYDGYRARRVGRWFLLQPEPRTSPSTSPQESSQ